MHPSRIHAMLRNKFYMGRIVWAGRPHGVLIGGDADDWDQVVLVEYPSRDAFIEMTSSDDYEDAHAHREAGLERTALLPCRAAIDAGQHQGEDA